MNAPQQLSIRQSEQAVGVWLSGHSHLVGKVLRHTMQCLELQKALGASWKEDVCTCNDVTELRLCTTCSASIKYKMTYLSIHDSSWGDRCAGQGEVIHRLIPYCPVCEPSPITYGCVHEPEIVATPTQAPWYLRFLSAYGFYRIKT